MGCAVDLQHESHGCLSVAAADRKQTADLDSAGRLRAPMGACRSRTNADDRLPLASLGRVEGGDGFVESRDVADVRPQSSVTRPPDNLTQLGAIGYDDEVNRPAVSGPCLGRAGDGHQRSSGSNHARGPLRDVAAEDIEHQIDPADIFQSVVFEVHKLLRAEVERRLTAGSAPGTDDVRPGLTSELGCHRTDYAGRTVHKDALPRLKAAVLEQPLPRGQARYHEGGAHREVDVPRQRREVACLDGYILRQRPVASPVREAEHPLSHRQPRRSIAEGGDHSGQLVAGDRRCPVTAEAIDPGRRPRQLIPSESRRMNLDNDIPVIRAREAGERRTLRPWPLYQLHPGRSRSLVHHHDRLHGNCLLVHPRTSMRWNSAISAATLNSVPGEIPPFCGCSMRKPLKGHHLWAFEGSGWRSKLFAP